LKDVFKKYALELVEVPRIEDGVGAISASRVRAAWTAGRMDEVEEWVPASTFAYLKSPEGTALCEALRREAS
jgi:[citrate (pro-3S)-lyase] ligase